MSGTPGHRASSAPLVDSWECLREMEAMWAQVYGPFDQYSMRHTRLLANLCNSVSSGCAYLSGQDRVCVCVPDHACVSLYVKVSARSCACMLIVY